MTMLADLKSFLELTTADQTAFNDVLDLILEAQKVRVDSYLGFAHFDTVTDNVVRFSGDRGIVALPHANITSVSVSIDLGDATEELDPDTLTVYVARGTVKTRFGELLSEAAPILVTYTGGYGEDDIPKDLRFATIKQAAYEFRRRRDLGLSAVRFPDGSVQKHEVGEWLPDVEKTLNKYRRIAL